MSSQLVHAQSDLQMPSRKGSQSAVVQGMVAQKLSAPAKAELQAKRVLVDLNKSLQDLHKESRSSETTASEYGWSSII